MGVWVYIYLFDSHCFVVFTESWYRLEGSALGGTCVSHHEFSLVYNLQHVGDIPETDLQKSGQEFMAVLFGFHLICMGIILEIFIKGSETEYNDNHLWFKPKFQLLLVLSCSTLRILIF